jgi:DMSO/TMAO reductase YedYZ molybdopterin-dependent catalytic subunit
MVRSINLNPEALLMKSGAAYMIKWELRGSRLVPAGIHCAQWTPCAFAEDSEVCRFAVGDGCVGIAYQKEEVIFLQNVATANEDDFARKSNALSHGIRSIVFLPQADKTVCEVGFEKSISEVPPVCLGDDSSVFSREDREAIKRSIPKIGSIVKEVDTIKEQFGFVEDVVKEPDVKDKDTPDKWVPRNPWMNRLTGIHPFNVEAPISLLKSKGFLTPATLHYVRNHGKCPDLSWHNHRIDVSGLVNKPMSISMAELVKLPTQSILVTLNCAGNRRKEQNIIQKGIGFNWGCGAASTCVWTGVPLRVFLEHVGIKSKEQGANFVSFFGPTDEVPQGDGSYGASHSTERCLDPTRNFMLAFMMNGELLHPDHGYPVRVLCPGYIGGRMIKWVTKIVVEEKESDNWYHVYDNRVFPKHVTSRDVATAENIWTDPAYVIHDRNINSAIWSPAHGEKIDLDQQTYLVQGYAYNGAGRPVNRVEITLNDGRNWRVAEIQR